MKYRRQPNPPATVDRMRDNPGWSMYAGGTGAAEGKHGYSYRVTGGTYHIDPFTSRTGRHAGYLLRFTTEGGARLPVAGLWTGVDRDGTAIPVHQVVVYRSPNEAKSAARAHGERYGLYESESQPNPPQYNVDANGVPFRKESLAMYLERTGDSINHVDGTAIQIVRPSDAPGLYWLNDYAVTSSASGPSYWLVPWRSRIPGER